MTTPSQNQSGTQASNATSRGGQNGGDLKETATQLADQAKSEGKKQVETARQTTVEGVEKLARSAKAAASELEGNDIGNLSQYLTKFADGMNDFASRLSEKSGADIATEITRVARQNPALFIAGGLVVGFGLARFARAKTPGSDSSDEYSQDFGSSASGTSAYGASSLSTGGLSGSTGAGIGSGSSSLGSTGSGLSGSGSSLSGSTGSSLGSGGIGGGSTTASSGASTAGSGTSGLNNYSPGSNLASGKDSSPGSIGGQGLAGSSDLDSSSKNNRGGINS